jgi:hypothetical protein
MRLTSMNHPAVGTRDDEHGEIVREKRDMWGVIDVFLERTESHDREGSAQLQVVLSSQYTVLSFLSNIL